MIKRLLGLFLALAFVCVCSAQVQAITIDSTADTGASWGGVTKTYVIYNEVTLTDVATGDVVQCLDIPAKTFVWDVFVKVITPITITAGTATVGDGAGADSWDAETDLKATALTTTHGASGTDAYATSGKYYAATDTIDLTCTLTGGPITAGKIRVYAICATIDN